MSNQCECIRWARAQKLLTEHHPRCPRYDPEGDAREVIKALVKGIDAWASDEDGVHDDCWDAYANAREMLFRPVSVERQFVRDQMHKLGNVLCDVEIEDDDAD